MKLNRHRQQRQRNCISTHLKVQLSREGGALEADEGLVKGWKEEELAAGETKVALMAGAGGARCGPRAQLG